MTNVAIICCHIVRIFSFICTMTAWSRCSASRGGNNLVAWTYSSLPAYSMFLPCLLHCIMVCNRCRRPQPRYTQAACQTRMHDECRILFCRDRSIFSVDSRSCSPFILSLSHHCSIVSQSELVDRTKCRNAMMTAELTIIGFCMHHLSIN